LYSSQKRDVIERNSKEGAIMDYMTTKDAAGLWGITVRQVQAGCESGRIEGALRMGHMWLIRKDAAKPIDGRTKAAKQFKLNAEVKRGE
jgi:hypothetical protein